MRQRSTTTRESKRARVSSATHRMRDDSVSRAKSGEIQISCRDTGLGIAEEEIPEVLSSFGQSSKTFDLAKEGVGLGLPICKGLIELHGGQLEIKSVLDAGTDVTITFPENRIIRGSSIPESLAA